MKLRIGENIRNYRKKNDLTQEVLADHLGVTYQSISRWENGITYPDLDPLRSHSEFQKLCDRVKALIVTKPKEE